MSDWRPGTDLEMLQARARMLTDIRAFFAAHDVLEVETPVLSRYAATDFHLDSLVTRTGEQPCFLSTSPEFAMKRLLAENPVAIYQVTKAFRSDEVGQYHNPEFSMLEWYRPGFDDVTLMDEVEALVSRLYHDNTGGRTFRVQRVSYHDAFNSVLGFDPHEVTAHECYRYALDHAIDIPLGMGEDEAERDGWLDWLLTQVVMPEVGTAEMFTFLYDYPSSQAALARVQADSEGRAVAKRFELFYGELELANGYFELTDALEQASRFERDNCLRYTAGKRVIPVDVNLLAALEHGMPSCAGVAIGLDRLLMVLTGSRSMDEVLSFSIYRA